MQNLFRLHKNTFLLTILLFFFTIFLFPLNVNARERDKQTSTGNNYIFKENVEIKEDIAGDLYAFGSKVIVEGEVLENANIAAGEVLINGDIGNDLSIAGGYVVINGNIDDDLRVVGGEVYINSLNIGGDLTVTGGNVYISSTTIFEGEELVSGGQINRNATNNPTTLEDSNYNEWEVNMDVEKFVKGITIFSIVVSLISIISTLITGIFIFKLFPVFTDQTVKTMQNNAPKSMGVGCLVMLLAPFAGLILLITLFGYKLLFLLIILGFLAFMLSEIYSKYLIGKLIISKSLKNDSKVLALFSGILIVDFGLILLGFVPFFGAILVGIISILLAAWGIGAIVLNKFRSA